MPSTLASITGVSGCQKLTSRLITNILYFVYKKSLLESKWWQKHFSRIQCILRIQNTYQLQSFWYSNVNFQISFLSLSLSLSLSLPFSLSINLSIYLFINLSHFWQFISKFIRMKLLKVRFYIHTYVYVYTGFPLHWKCSCSMTRFVRLSVSC